MIHTGKISNIATDFFSFFGKFIKNQRFEESFIGITLTFSVYLTAVSVDQTGPGSLYKFVWF